MNMKKDKQKVLGEHFDEERIAGFLEGQAPDGMPLDYYLLERAYRGMKAENFATFLQLFTKAGHDINCTGPDGKNLLTRMQEHRQSEEYIAAMRASGAQ